MAESTENAIEVRNLKKSFHIPLEQSSGIKQKLINVLKGRKGYRELSPLNGISFDIQKGDFFGIVGRNGSGKSTLLKTIAGIYSPTEGSVRVDGKLVPFIELGVGFNPELTGRENVYLNGALLGFSHADIDEMYDDIVDFAELHDFMAERLKNYSSGMQVRLAFSIAIRAKGDILLLDEVLAVGDEAFQRKCTEYFAQLKEDKKTVVLVTHSMSAVEQFCNKAMLLDEGEVKAIGTSGEIATMYSQLFIKQQTINHDRNSADKEDTTKQDIVAVEQARILQFDKETTEVEAGKPFTIEVSFVANTDLGDCVSGINLVNAKNNILIAAGAGTIRDDEQLTIPKGRSTIVCHINDNNYTDDSYSINVALAQGRVSQTLLIKERGVANFSIRGSTGRQHGLTHPSMTMEVRHG